jgi:hypothetical protein
MKIRFNTGDYRMYCCPEEVEFEIVGIYYECDENGPVDIVIYGSKETLQKISELVQSGSVIQEIDDYYPRDIRMKGLGATHVCLYARLPEFTVLGMNRVIYQ